MAGDITVATLVAKLEADVKSFDRDLKRAEGRIKGLEQNVGKSSSMMGGHFKSMAKAAAVSFGAAGVVGFMKSGVMAAADLEESVNAVRVVFGDAADSVLAFAADTEDAVFEAEGKLNQMATTTGALLTNFGFTADAAAKETITLTRRAADMASVFNVDVSEAMMAIQQALRGETEAIRRFGGNVDEASIKTYALANNIWDGTEAMTQNEKVAARVGLIMEQTAKVQGDAANTADSFQNQMRKLNEQFYNAQVQVGKELLPVLVELLPKIINLIPAVADIAMAFADIASPILTIVGVGAGFISWLSDASALMPILAMATGAWATAWAGAKVLGMSQGLGTLATMMGVTAGSLGVVGAALVATGLIVNEFVDGVEWGNGAFDRWREAIDMMAKYELANLSDTLLEAIRNIGTMNITTLAVRDAIRLQAQALGVAVSGWRQAATNEGPMIVQQQIEFALAARNANNTLATQRQRLLELSSPVYAAAAAADRLAEAQRQVHSDGVATAEELAELAQLTLEYQVAMDQVNPANVTATQDAMQVALGITKDAAVAATSSLLTLDQTDAVSTIVVDGNAMGVLGDAKMKLQELDRYEAQAWLNVAGPYNNNLDYAVGRLREIRAFNGQSYFLSMNVDIGGSVTSGTGTTNIYLARGGPAMAGQPYIVGEEGPELFVPRQSGTVIPNDETMATLRKGTGGGSSVAAGTSVNVNITAPVGFPVDRYEQQKIVRALADATREWERGLQ